MVITPIFFFTYEELDDSEVELPKAIGARFYSHAIVFIILVADELFLKLIGRRLG